MLWFIAILVTLNLCVGYALGAQHGWSLLGLEGFSLPRIPLPGLSLLKRKNSASDADEEPAEPPAPEAAALDPTETAPYEASAGPVEDLANDAPQSSDPPPENQKPKASAADVMEGLAAFQAQLAGLSQELNEADEDDAFDDCAERMQQANHEYIDHAQDAINQLDEDEQAAPVCQAVKAGADEVQRVSNEFDATLAADQEGGRDDASREKLRGISSEMVETTKSVEKEVRRAAPDLAPPADESPIADLPPLAIDATNGLATLDSLLARIESLLADGQEKPPLLVATVQADSSDENPLPAETLPLLLPKIGEAIAEKSDDVGPPALYKGEQLIIALPGDSVDDASRRVEQIRQQVEATTFLDSGEERQITVSCAMAQSSPESTVEELEQLLAEALSEAHRYGGNRACHHDGKFPAPVMPEDYEPASRTVAL